MRTINTGRLLFLAAFALLAGTAACASSGGSGSGEGGGRRNPNLITMEELADHSALMAYDVIRRLRPRWLQARGGSANQPQLFVDGARMGMAEAGLRSMPVSDIQELQFLNASDATMRFGTNFPGGAILVTSRAR